MSEAEDLLNQRLSIRSLSTTTSTYVVGQIIEFAKEIADKAFDAGRKNGRDEAMDDFNITKLHQDDPDKETFINDLFKDK